MGKDKNNIPEGFVADHVLTGEPLNYELVEDWHSAEAGGLNEGMERRLWRETTTDSLTEELRKAV